MGASAMEKRRGKVQHHPCPPLSSCHGLVFDEEKGVGCQSLPVVVLVLHLFLRES